MLSFTLPIVLIQPASVPAPLPGSVISAILYGAMQIVDTVQKHFIDWMCVIMKNVSLQG